MYEEEETDEGGKNTGERDFKLWQRMKKQWKDMTKRKKKTTLDEVTLEYAKERKKLRTFRSIYNMFPPF